MALIDKASLLMVPSVYEDGTLYNVLPSGNKAPDETGNHNGYDQTRADFTFSRGFNLTATRVNADGLIEKGRENILLRSNDFDTTWTDFSGASGQSGYDGNSNAWRYDSSSSALRLQQVGISISGVKTYSIYAKYVDAQWFSLQIAGASTEGAWFDIQNGTLGTTTNAIDSKIEAVGTDGWYRCSVTGSVDSQNRVRLYVVGSDGSSTTITGSIYIQDAQLEVGLVATDYIETGATTATAGVLENTPRIDYSSGAGALLLESQRSNLVSQSEYLNGITSAGGTITDNATISPEGLQNAGVYIENTTNTYHRFNTGTQSYTSGTSYTFSVFAKSYSGNRFLIMNCSSAFGARTYFDLSDGTKNVVSGTADIQDYGNGWYRCSVTGTRAAATGFDSIYFGLNSTEADSAYTGDGVSGMYFWGAQLEAGSYVSSYIPTYGSAATRGADSCSVTGVSDVIGQTEGTAYIEFEIDNLSESGNEKVLFYMKDTGTGERYLSFVNNGSLTYIESNGVVIANISKTGLSVGSYKAAIAYKTNDFAFYLNGEQVGTDNAGTPSGFSTFGFQYYNSAVAGTQFSKQAVLFNERLTNEELATLTTL